MSFLSDVGKSVSGFFNAGPKTDDGPPGGTAGGDENLGANHGGSSAPYVSSPGLSAGKAIKHLKSLNTANPGTGEQYFTDNAQVWQNPTFSEVNDIGLVGHYSDPGNRPQVTNNQQDWFNQYVGQMPNIAQDPGLSPYYDNAERRSTEAINQALAARGAYGSSAANDQISRGITDLEADKAHNEADYNLRRLGEQRAWQGLGGQLAGGADSQSMNQSQNEQAWAALLSKLGYEASKLGLERTNAGMDAAASAQNLNRNRGNDHFTQQMLSGDKISELMLRLMGPAVDNDATFMTDESSGGVAGANAKLNNERTNTQDTLGYLKDGVSAYNAFKNP